MRITTKGAGLAVVLAIAGCGGSSSDLSTPSATIKTYLNAVGSGNGQAACDTLSPKLQQQAVQSAKATGIKADTCAQLFSQVKSHLTADQRKKFTNAKVIKVKETGNTATVSVEGASSSPELTKTGGKWLITGGVGF
jgi:hypothetical protein